MTEERPNIFIGFVALGRDIDIEIASMLLYLGSTGKYMIWMNSSHGCYICQNRNNIVKAFKQTEDAEWLFNWDTDVVVRDDTFLDKLLETAKNLDAKIVGGCYRMKNSPQLVPICMDDGKGWFTNFKAEDLKEPRLVDYVAGGLMLIHRDVIEKIPPPWFQTTNYPDRVFPDDFHLCKLAREAGFKIAVDPRFDTWHIHNVGVQHHYEGKQNNIAQEDHFFNKDIEKVGEKKET
jgi:GT2 family glycosyltransferase